MKEVLRAKKKKPADDSSINKIQTTERTELIKKEIIETKLIKFNTIEQSNENDRNIDEK